MTNIVSEIAAFLRARRSADRGELLRELIARWPDISGTDLQRAIDLRSGGRPVLVLSSEPARQSP